MSSQSALVGAPGVKVAVPALGRFVVPRPDRVEELDALVAAHRVTLVVAPAGFGKSTLLASWAAAAPGRTVAWLALDASDNDPVRLVHGLAGAVAVAVPGPAGRAGVARPAARTVDELLVALDSTPDGLVVVVDDVHELDAEVARQVLGRLVRYAPPGLRLVLASRYDPPLPLHRLRLAGELGEVRERTLAFDGEEVARLASSSGVVLSAGEAGELRSLTGGWPVAVRMSLMSLAADADPGARVRRMPALTVPVADYLVDEVLAGLPAALAEFVLRATVDDVMDPVLAERLVAGGARLLDECVARGLFLTRTVPLPGRGSGAGPAGPEPAGPVYRWHALFAAQCRVLLGRRDPDLLAATHRAVAEHRRSSDWVSAVRHASAAGDDALAADLLHGHWADLLVEGDTALLRRLLAQLPATLARDSGVLLATAAADVQDGRGDLVALAHARRAAQGAWSDADELVGRLLGPALSSAGQVAPAVAWAAPALGRPGVDPATRAFGLYLVGRVEAQVDDDSRRAREHLTEGATVALAHGLPAIAAGCRAEQSLLLADDGEVARADDAAERVLDQGAEAGWTRTSALASAHLARGLAAFWQDRLVDARSHLAAAAAGAGRQRPEVAVRAAAVLALVCLAEDDGAGFARARAAAGEDPRWRALPPFADVLAVVDTVAHVRHGDLAAGLRTVHAVAADATHPLAVVWEAETERRAGHPLAADRTLDRLASVRVRAHVEVSAALTRALLRSAEQDDVAAHRSLEHALAVAAPDGLRRPFVDRADDLYALLVAHLAWGSAHEELAAGFLAARPPSRTSRGAVGAWELTAREHEVLVRLRSTMTTTEIGAALFVSTNTVKTHQRSIYRKLGVAGRREAVRLAAEQGLM
ncbi:LuxR C-terminal-related transcriptional regulator [Cellulomonas sp. URHB0016]